jgi:hypothetical protein
MQEAKSGSIVYQAPARLTSKLKTTKSLFLNMPQYQLSAKQVKCFNNGYIAYAKRLMVIALAFGAPFIIAVFASGMKLSAPHGESQLFLKCKMSLIILAGILLLGWVTSWRSWTTLGWTVWKVIGQHWHFNKTTLPEIAARLGQPETMSERNGIKMAVYENVLDPETGIRIKKLSFYFRQDTLVEYRKT